MKKNTTILIIRLLKPMLHAVMISLSFWWMYLLRQQTDLIPGVQLKIPDINGYELLLFATLSLVIFLVVGFGMGLYQLNKSSYAYPRKFFVITFIWFALSTSLAYYGDNFLFVGGVSRFIILLSTIVSVFGMILVDSFLSLVINKFLRRYPYRVLVIYHGENTDEIESEINDKDIFQCEFQSRDYLNEDFQKKISKIDIVVMTGNYSKNSLQEIADKTTIAGKQFFHLPESYFLEDGLFQSGRLGSIPAFEYIHSPLDGRYRVVKRMFDILFSLCFIVIFSWLYLLIGVLILIIDGWPIIYTSYRVGKNEKQFPLYKFRTMVKNAEALKQQIIDQNERQGPLFKIDRDPRVTRLGNILRKTSLDEIPQFFNVLKGEMSVVGPRPHLPQEIEQYEPWQKRLLRIKPGITGYAQIFGRDKLSFQDEAKFDLYYSQNWSLLIDVYVIVNTVRVILSGK